MQKEENDTLITDNKKLPHHQKTAVTKTTFWGPQAGVLAPGPPIKERRIDDRNVDWIGVVHNDINRTD